MASSPIASQQIDGEIMEIVTDLIFGGSKITADGDCSHEFKSGNSERLYFWGAPKSLQMATAIMKLKMLAPWKKSYDHPTQPIKK